VEVDYVYATVTFYKLAQGLIYTEKGVICRSSCCTTLGN